MNKIYEITTDYGIITDVTKCIQIQCYIDWNVLSKLNHSPDFIDTFNTSLNWVWMSHHIQESLIEKYKDRVDWHVVSRRRQLSTEFIREAIRNKLPIDWGLVSYSNINANTVEFINEFHHDINWKAISYRADLSTDVASVYGDKIDFDVINSKNINLTKLKKFSYKFDWSILISVIDINHDIVDMYLDDICNTFGIDLNVDRQPSDIRKKIKDTKEISYVTGVVSSNINTLATLLCMYT